MVSLRRKRHIPADFTAGKALQILLPVAIAGILDVFANLLPFSVNIIPLNVTPIRIIPFSLPDHAAQPLILLNPHDAPIAAACFSVPFFSEAIIGFPVVHDARNRLNRSPGAPFRTVIRLLLFLRLFVQGNKPIQVPSSPKLLTQNRIVSAEEISGFSCPSCADHHRIFAGTSSRNNALFPWIIRRL